MTDETKFTTLEKEGTNALEVAAQEDEESEEEEKTSSGVSERLQLILFHPWFAFLSIFITGRSFLGRMVSFDTPVISHLFGLNSLVHGVLTYPRFLDFAEVRSGERVVDVGCGFGSVLVGSYNFKGLDLIGVDDSLFMVRNAGIVLGVLGAVSRSHQRQVVYASGDQLPFSSGTIDIVIDAHCSSYYHGHQREFVQEYHRVLRPGGRMVLAPYVPSRCAELAEAVEKVFGSFTAGNNFVEWMGSPPLKATKNG